MERPLLLPNGNTVNKAMKKRPSSVKFITPIYPCSAQVSEGEVTSSLDNEED